MEKCKYIGDCENKCLTHCLEKTLMENNKELTPMMELKPIFLDYYLNNFKWYRKLRKRNWYHHEFTSDAEQLTFQKGRKFWALYPKINRYSKVIETEFYK